MQGESDRGTFGAPPRRPGAPRRRLLAACGSIALALACLVLAELVLRATAPTAPRPFTFASAFPTLAGDRLLVEHDRRFYTLAAGYRHAESHLGRYACGQWPFRGRPPRPVPAGIARVIVLGDSCVFGTGLDAADTLPARIAAELVPLGLDPTRVQVLNLGVPGYSTVQVRLLLEQALAELEPAVVVLYPAAWNDQAPAMGLDDVELARQSARPSVLQRLRRGALARRLRDALGAPDAEPERSLEEVQEAWTRGEPIFGTRVPEEAVAEQVGRMLDACEERGAAVVVVPPTHPADTAERHPRTRLDSATVRRVAAARGATVVDAEGPFAAACPTDEERFLDFVHPSPRAVRALAVPVAAAVAAALAGRGPEPSGAPFSIVSVEPAAVSSLGDAELTVRLSADLPQGPTPAVVVGGAPLIGVERAGARALVGRLPANAPGRRGVLVQAEAGCAWLADAIELVPPAVERTETELVLRSRPGDRGRIHYAAERRASPLPTPNGERWLVDAELLSRAFDLECGPDGLGRTPLPPEAAELDGTVWVQALVLPRGLPVDLTGSRWSALAELHFGAR